MAKTLKPKTPHRTLEQQREDARLLREEADTFEAKGLPALAARLRAIAERTDPGPVCPDCEDRPGGNPSPPPHDCPLYR